MAWIESHQELARHPKTKRFARSANISIPCAIGHLHLLWWWCMDYAQDGNLSQWEASDIADAVHWEGEPEKLLEALIESRFVDLIDEVASIHDWADYGGRLMAIKQKDRERKRKSDALRRNSSGIRAESAVTQHNPTEPNPTEPHTTETQPNQEPVDGVVVGEGGQKMWQTFWNSYPKKTSETEAREAWRILNPDETLTAQILHALEVAKRSEQWTKENGKFMPKAVNWLNKKAWEGEPQNDPNQPSTTAFSLDGMSGFHNALDQYDDDGNEITE